MTLPAEPLSMEIVRDLLSWDIDELEAELLKLPQVECPVAHHFGPGVYVREATFPPGTFVIGHEHRHASTNMMLKGRLALLTPDGDIREVVAPLIMTTDPGRKAAYAMEETVWVNVFPNPTDETDIEALEARFVVKSPAWQEAQCLL